MLRTVVGLALILAAMVGAGLLTAGFEIGLGMLASFCLVALVWMAFNSWALLFAIAHAETMEAGSPPQKVR